MNIFLSQHFFYFVATHIQVKSKLQHNFFFAKMFVYEFSFFTEPSKVRDFLSTNVTQKHEKTNFVTFWTRDVFFGTFLRKNGTCARGWLYVFEKRSIRVFFVATFFFLQKSCEKSWKFSKNHARWVKIMKIHENSVKIMQLYDFSLVSKTHWYVEFCPQNEYL